MKKLIKKALADQRIAFIEDLTTRWGIHQDVIAARSNEIRHIFDQFLSLSCAATVLSNNRPRATYLKALPEAAYLSMVMAFKGARNTCAVLNRQAIELVLKDIYFSTHPIEYNWTQKKTGYRELTFQSLIDYLKNMEECDLIPSGAEFVPPILDWYAKLSSHVHTHSAAHIGFPDIKQVLPTDVNIDVLRKVADGLWPVLVFILCVFFQSEYCTAQSNEKDLIRDCFSKKLKRHYSEWEYNFSTASLNRE